MIVHPKYNHSLLALGVVQGSRLGTPSPENRVFVPRSPGHPGHPNLGEACRRRIHDTRLKFRFLSECLHNRLSTCPGRYLRGLERSWHVIVTRCLADGTRVFATFVFFQIYGRRRAIDALQAADGLDRWTIFVNE